MKVACSLLALAGSLAGSAHAAGNDALYAAAMEHYEAGLYAAAYAGLSEAADAGHLRAQEIAGLMSLVGPALYGEGVPENQQAAMRWLPRAAQSGSEVARHVFCAHTRRAGGADNAVCMPR